MSSKRHKGPQFARLDFDFIDTAIEPISSGATRLYILFLRRYNGHNNGLIALSVREAMGWCKCAQATAHAYLKELQLHGLIEPVVVGSFQIKSGDRKNHATTWRLPFLVEAA